MVNFTSDSKSIMIYSIALWSVILISSVVSLVASATSIQVGFLMVPVSFLTAPMFGLRMILKSTFINYIFLGLISITFIGVNSYFLSRYLKY
ncbi:MAG: hypothetical protein WBK75_08350 [Acutalibacteraceae bacterium]|nr:hypothetical protein [Clostridiales bacterium]